MADNNTANVSSGKGVKGGYFFAAAASDANLAIIRAATNTKDFTKKVTEIFADAVNLGYISEDGWKISEDRNVEKHVDVNGETVDSSTTSFIETITATLLEKKTETLKEIYGQGNVSESDGVIEALHTGDDAPQRIYVAELVLKNGRRWRYIVPLGQITEKGEESIAANSLVGREVTITGNTFAIREGKSTTSVDYIQSIESDEPHSGQDEG